jgi:hypothetical protein
MCALQVWNEDLVGFVDSFHVGPVIAGCFDFDFVSKNLDIYCFGLMERI